MSNPTDELTPRQPRPTTTPYAEAAETGARPRRLGLALMIISAAQLMVVLDASIVNIALPHIQLDLGFSQANLSWVVNAYTLAFGSLLLLGGRAGDLLGRRRVFIAGVLLFAVASLVGGLAQDQTILLTGRILQGVGAAIASPTALSLITTTFPPGRPRNRAFAVYAAMSGAGAAVGLILGGALTEASWRWTFFINVPIGILVAVLAPRFLAESPRRAGRFDLPGAITGTAGLVGIVYGLTHAATDGWTDTVTLALLVGGTALLAVFLAVESRSTHALMPFRILAHRDRGTSYVVMLAVGAALFAMFYFLGIYVQTVLGYSSLRAGFAFLPFSAGIILGAQVASYLAGRVDPRWIAGAGGLLAAAAMGWMTQLSPTSTYLGGLLGPIVVLALGIGLIFVPLTLTAVSGVRNEDSGVASAVLNTMQQIGGALGLAVLSTVATTAATDRAKVLGATLQHQLATGQVPREKAAALQLVLQHDAFTHGATAAFTVGSLMVATATAITVGFLRVRHQELATETVLVDAV